jgi:hypothetical protein
VDCKRDGEETFDMTTAVDWIAYIVLGGVLGSLGQVIRSVAGLKKAQDATIGGAAGFGATFEWPVFVVSLIIGFTAGALACLTMAFPAALDAKFLLTFIAAGYAGADFIEAFIKKYPPGIGSSGNSGTVAPRNADLSLSSPQTRPHKGEALMTMSTEEAVIQVIAEVKHINSGRIALSDKLSDLQFDHAGRRDLANEINGFFQHRLNMVFDTLMHPGETADDQTVGEVIQKVKAKHPRPITQPAAATT